MNWPFKFLFEGGNCMKKLETDCTLFCQGCLQRAWLGLCSIRNPNTRFQRQFNNQRNSVRSCLQRQREFPTRMWSWAYQFLPRHWQSGSSRCHLCRNSSRSQPGSLCFNGFSIPWRQAPLLSAGRISFPFPQSILLKCILQCAMEENCLGQEAYRLRRENPNFSLESRRLLRFTSSIANVGDADFRPFIPKTAWQWHACHMHYHSMEVCTFLLRTDLTSFSFTLGVRLSSTLHH